jgi:hypothetical protein
VGSPSAFMGIYGTCTPRKTQQVVPESCRIHLSIGILGCLTSKRRLTDQDCVCVRFVMSGPGFKLVQLCEFMPQAAWQHFSVPELQS